MSAFGAAFKQFFLAFTVLFAAFEKICKTADNLATVAEENSGQYKDEARIIRAANKRQLEQQHNVQLPAPTQQVTT